MRIIRYTDATGGISYGAYRGDEGPFEIDGDVYGRPGVSSRPADVHRLLSPVAPAAILGIGLNYRRHAHESGLPIPEYPVLFFKTPGSVQHPGEPIELPRGLPSLKVDYECELAAVIGRHCKNVSPEEALDHVLGYTCANDVSARDWQIERGGGQWSRGKTFDTFCPLGPCLVTPDEVSDPNSLTIRTVLNGRMVQDWNTSDMIFDVPHLISFLSGSTTLVPGTVILTGTPHGVGMAANPPRWLEAGDVVTIEIEGIGALTNPVIEERLHGE